jgi:hypothetical protein
LVEIGHILLKLRMPKSQRLPHQNSHLVVCIVAKQELQKVSANEAVGTDKKS